MTGEALALLGAVLVLLSALGVMRFPDPLARLHALAKASTLGILLILAGAAVNLPDLDSRTSVVLAAFLHLLASPPASNMVSRAVYLSRGTPAGEVDEHARDAARHLAAHPGTDGEPPPGRRPGG